MKTNNIILINNLNSISKRFKENGKNIGDTIELNNVILSYQEFKNIEKKPPNKKDEEERDWLYKNINYPIKKLKNNKNTRQAIFYNKYDSELDYNCLNSFHLYFRKKKLYLNVYIRSMNYDINFEYDLYTFNILLNKACNVLMLDKGQIILFIMSLHKFKKYE